MSNLEEIEVQRIKNLLDKMEKEYPKSMETEALIQDTFERISTMDKAIIKSSLQVCKPETEELNKFSTFSDQMALEMKDNVDEGLFESSLKNWQSCLQLKHKDFAETLYTMDNEFNSNNVKMNNCVEDCVANSTSKTNEELEKCLRSCMINHEGLFNEITRKYNGTFRDYQNKYQQYL